MLDLGRVPAPRALPPDRREALRALLEDVVSTTPQRRRWWFSRSMVLVVTGAAVLGSAAAAGALVAAKPATDKRVVRCYSVAALDGGDEFAGATVARGGGSGPIPIEDALATCAELWRQGVVVAGVASAQDPGIGVDAPVPELAACTLETGVAAVFPGDAGTCGRLGLPDLLAG